MPSVRAASATLGIRRRENSAAISAASALEMFARAIAALDAHRSSHCSAGLRRDGDTLSISSLSSRPSRITHRARVIPSSAVRCWTHSA